MYQWKKIVFNYDESIFIFFNFDDFRKEKKKKAKVIKRR